MQPKKLSDFVYALLLLGLAHIVFLLIGQGAETHSYDSGFTPPLHLYAVLMTRQMAKRECAMFVQYHRERSQGLDGVFKDLVNLQYMVYYAEHTIYLASGSYMRALIVQLNQHSFWQAADW